MDEQNFSKNQKRRTDYKAEGIKVIGVAFELGFIIALPILAFATFGKWLDNKYHSSYFIYLGIVLAVISTSLWLYRRFSEMVRKLEDAAKSQTNKNVNQNNKQKEQE